MSQFHLNLSTQIEAGLTNGRKLVTWDDVTKRFLFYKTATLTNLVDSFRYQNVKYVIKSKIILVALISCQPFSGYQASMKIDWWIIFIM